MSIEVDERFKSRRFTGNSYEFLYLARAGAGESEEALQGAIIATSPADYQGYDRAGITDWEQEGNDLWFATVTYASPGTPGGAGAEATQSFDFDTSSGTMHLQEAFSQTSYDLTGAGQPDFGEAIQVTGVGEDMKVEGIDLGVKALDFTITRKIPIASFTQAYLQALYDLSWTYNKDNDLSITFMDGITIAFPAGTILYKGARGGGQEGELITIALSLSFSPNISFVKHFSASETAGALEVTIAKKGWQYLWYRYMPDIRDDSLILRAVGAYVADVYDAGDLTQLNID